MKRSAFDELEAIISKPFFNVEKHESGDSEKRVFKVRFSVMINESYFATRLNKKDALKLAESLTRVANELPDDEVKE